MPTEVPLYIMNLFGVRKYPAWLQLTISLGLIVTLSVASYFASDFIGYRTVALVLLLAVSVLAMLFDVMPVLVTAFFSAVIWNFFFIPPVFTLHIGSPEDALMALMYFVVALINVVLSSKIRQFEKEARDKQERDETIRLYDTMLNSLSHELRTPIAAIIGSVDAIKSEQGKITEEQKRELIAEIEVAAERLNQQVGNLISMSRLESGVLKMRPDWCDVNELVHYVLKRNEQHRNNREVIFKQNEKLPLMFLDRKVVEQVLQNLIVNSYQHTPDNSVVEIQVKHTNGECEIIVSDNGNGFPPEFIENVFEKFYRLPGSGTGGIGLGLSIARGFVLAHGGTLNLTQNQPNGAVFTVRIPCEVSKIKIGS
jgi:two-component system, OmpR family, sensor histidine kinase KdpD